MKPLRRRWKQTAEQGYVPNSVLENVFMAAAMDDDMGDYHAGNIDICKIYVQVTRRTP